MMARKKVCRTRSKPAYGRLGLDWIFRPEYSFRVFSTTRFAPAALSSVEVIIFCDTHSFVITGEIKHSQTDRQAVIINRQTDKMEDKREKIDMTNTSS